MGISFYTFQMISLLADTKNEKISFIDFCAMSMYFPKLVMGPLVRYKDYKDDLKRADERRLVTAEGIEEGARLFTAGMFIKVVIADNLATLWNSINVAGAAGITTSVAWLGAITYTIELYMDFFGYSLMAVALGKMFGINLPENFNEPYSSRSVGEFWRRWHITLGAWFRDYIYIPLGGSKKGTFRNILNLLIVWLITGFWHGFGLNFIIWGLMLFVLIVLEKFTPLGKLTKVKGLGNVYLIFVIVISWVIFAINDISSLTDYLKCLFGIRIEGASPAGSQFMRYIRTYWYLLAGGILAMTPLSRIFAKKFGKKWWMVLILAPMFALSVYFIIQGKGGAFMYYIF
ncbi:MAG: MBOAT family protein [Lachnospiraceae bacterium]|nr:MBOAT family protein [Lachnospiraceae bacterium]